MDIIQLTEENIYDYEDFLDSDAVSNIGREYYRGIMVTEGDGESLPVAYMIWEYKHLHEEADTQAKIVKLYANDVKSGKKLLDEFSKITEEIGVKRCYFRFSPDETEAADLLKNAGFTVETKEGPITVVTLSELEGLPIVKSTVPDYIVPIEDLMIRQFRNGISRCVESGHKGVLEDIDLLPMSWFEEDVSCSVYSDGEVSGFLLVHATAGGDLLPDLFFAFEPDARKKLLLMIAHAIRRALDKYPQDTRVLLPRYSETSHALIKKLFPNKTGEQVIFGERVR